MAELVTVRTATVCLVCGDDIWQGERAYAVCGGHECIVCRARQAAPEFMDVADRHLMGLQDVTPGGGGDG